MVVQGGAEQTAGMRQHEKVRKCRAGIPYQLVP